MNANKHNHTEQEKLEKAGRICDLVRLGNTLASACKSEDITDRTFRDWRAKDKSGISALYKIAMKDRREELHVDLVQVAEDGLYRLANGYRERKVKIKYIRKKDNLSIDLEDSDTYIVSEHEIIEEIIKPNLSAQIFILTNRLPDLWKHRAEMIHKGAVLSTGVDLERIKAMSGDEIREAKDKIAQLMSKLRPEPEG